MDASAAEFLESMGGSAQGFAARRLTSDMALEADLILTATKDIRERVLQMAPATLRRTFTSARCVAAACTKDFASAATHMGEAVDSIADRLSEFGLATPPTRRALGE